MKPTKIRNLQIYRATQNVLSKQLGSNLSKDLRQKYGKRSIRVTVGDTVKVVRGEYKGIDGKVKEVDTLKNAVTIEGIKKEKLKGGQFDVFINSSNLLVTELNANDKWRIQKLEGTKSKISMEKETKPKDQQEVKQKEAKEEEKHKEPKETQLTPKQESKTRQIKKTPKEPKTKPAPKTAKKTSKEKKDEK